MSRFSLSGLITAIAACAEPPEPRPEFSDLRPGEIVVDARMLVEGNLRPGNTVAAH